MQPLESHLSCCKSALPFASITSSDFPELKEKLLADAKRRIAQIASAANPSYEQTFKALDECMIGIDRFESVVDLYYSVNIDDQLRKTYPDIKKDLSVFRSGIPLNSDLWRSLKAAAQSASGQKLTGEKKRLQEKIMRDFLRLGADLPKESKTELLSIESRLSEATSMFSRNVLDATNAFELLIADERELAGLPDRAIAAAKKDAEAHGQQGYRLTLQYPSVEPILTHADNRELRKKVSLAYNSRAAGGQFDNSNLVRAILGLRQQKANLLGFRNFPDLVLEDRMAKNSATVASFLADLKERAQKNFSKENQEIKNYWQELSAASDFQVWDVGYAAEKMLKAKFSFDEEELRPYFPLDKVMQGLFTICERLFGIRFRVLPSAETWHPDVMVYEVSQGQGAPFGLCYIDLFPRENKRDGAWMGSLALRQKGSDELSVAVVCANFTKPLGHKPSLLKHREVETLFHEFGHLLHHLCSLTETRLLGGTDVSWDFVELPSQIMENWCWEREALNIFAAHYETGAKIPEELFTKLVSTRKFRAATFFMRQIGLSTLDLKLHVEPDPGTEIKQRSRNILQDFFPTQLPEEYSLVTSFLHLFSDNVGYAGGYYSYKWAEVLEADAFSRFKNEGILSSKVGESFKSSILEKGNSEEPDKLYRDFMGRDPDSSALFSRLGLI